MSVAAPYTVRTMPRTTSNPKTGRFEFKISDTGKKLLAASAADQGISQAAVIEIAIREFAEKRGIKPPAAAPPDRTADTPGEYRAGEKDDG